MTLLNISLADLGDLATPCNIYQHLMRTMYPIKLNMMEYLDVGQFGQPLKNKQPIVDKEKD
jgi:hypothetical protein